MQSSNFPSLRECYIWFSRIFVCVACLFVLTACKPSFGRSTDTDLETLTILDNRDSERQGDLEPNFSKSETEYLLEVAEAVEYVVFRARTDSENATMTLQGQSLDSGEDRRVDLAVGDNTIELVVTAENESTKTYEFVIDRSATSSSNADLDRLSLSGIDLPVFSPVPTVFPDVEVSYFVNRTALSALPENGEATMTYTLMYGSETQQEGALGSGNLEGLFLGVGDDNEITIDVTAGDQETTKKYSVPITRRDRDSVTSNPASIKPSTPGAGDLFGSAISVGYDAVAIGAPEHDDQGAVYVFSSDLTSQLTTSPLVSSNPQDGALFGSAVSLYGDLLAVGAPGEEDGAITGRVEVFESTNGEWDQPGEEIDVNSLTLSEGDEFGYAVSMFGDYLAVGAPGTNEDSGALYIFENDGSEWVPVQNEPILSGEAGDRLGEALQFNTETTSDGEIVVGAPNANTVYLLQLDDDAWSQVATITAESSDEDDLFGAAVSMLGNIIAVGAPEEDGNATGIGTEGDESNNDQEGAGAVYVFERSGFSSDTWEKTAYLKATETESMNFGTSVSLDTGMLVVGAPLEDGTDVGANADDTMDAGNRDNSGAAYLFSIDADDVWTPEMYIKSGDPGANDNFGSALQLYGGRLVVGAENEDATDATNSGAIYLYE